MSAATSSVQLPASDRVVMGFLGEHAPETLHEGGRDEAGVETSKVDPLDGNTRIPHGTVSGYCYHRCRCDDCRQANTLATKRRDEHTRNGPLLVDKKPLVAVLRYALEAGISLAEIEREAGLRTDYLCDIISVPGRVHRRKQEKVLKAVGKILDGRQEALDDCRSSVDFAGAASRGRSRR